MVVQIDGTNYVRSIQKANPDSSLDLFCAIEEGLVLRRAVGVGKLEITERGLVERVEALMHENNVIGFNSYGEQYGGVRINQTLTGIAFAEPVSD